MDKYYNKENDELIIEDNTVYEIDLECYECLMKEREKEKKKKQKGGKKK